MALSLGQAAKAAGRGRSTIHRALKDGELTGTQDGKGRWHIEPAELFRVFQKTGEDADPRAPTEHLGGRSGTAQDRQDRPGGEGAEALHVRVELLTEMLERERGLNDELRGELRAANERVMGLLAAPPRRSLGDALGGLWARLTTTRKEGTA